MLCALFDTLSVTTEAEMRDKQALRFVRAGQSQHNRAKQQIRIITPLTAKTERNP